MVELDASRAIATNYFAFHSEAKVPTSDNVFSARFPQVQEISGARDLDSGGDGSGRRRHHDAAIERAGQRIRSMFPEWQCQLLAGFNLLLYGYGSKVSLVEEFCDTHLSACHRFVVSGFECGSGSIHELLRLVATKATRGSGQKRAARDAAVDVSADLATLLDDATAADDEPRICVLVHQIDAPALRSADSQEALAVLAQCRRVLLVATMDNPAVSLLWDRRTTSRFNWLCHDCTTMLPYERELLVVPEVVGHLAGTKRTTMKGAQFVLNSLPQNSRAIFRLLAAHQLSRPEPVEGAEEASTETSAEMGEFATGMSEFDLFQRSQEQFIVSNEAAFRTQLTEFKDHQIMLTGSGPDGTPILYIPFGHDDIRRLLLEIE